MLALKLDNSTKKPLQNNIGRRKAVTRAVWAQVAPLIVSGHVILGNDHDTNAYQNR